MYIILCISFVTFLSSFTAVILSMFFFTLIIMLITFLLRADTNGTVYVTTTAT